MYGQAEALQWYDPALLFSHAPLSGAVDDRISGFHDGTPSLPSSLPLQASSRVSSSSFGLGGGETITTDVSGYVTASEVLHRTQERARVLLQERIAAHTLSTDRDADAGAASLLHSLHTGTASYASAAHPAATRSPAVAASMMNPLSDVGHRVPASLSGARAVRSSVRGNGRARALGLASGVWLAAGAAADGDGGFTELLQSVSEEEEEETDGATTFTYDEDTGEDSLTAGWWSTHHTDPSGSREAADAAQAKELRDYFAMLPRRIGVQEEPVLCPLNTQTDPLAHVVASAEVFAAVTATTPQVLYFFDQLNQLPISSCVLSDGTTYQATSGALDMMSDSAGGGSGRRVTLDCPTTTINSSTASNSPSAAAYIAPCTIAASDRVEQLSMDPTGHYCVMIFTSGKCVYYYIPRRSSNRCGDGSSAAHPQQGVVTGDGEDEDDDGEGDGASAGERNGRRRRQQRHSEWKEAARTWLRLRRHSSDAAALDAAAEKAAADAAAAAAAESDNDAAYRPRGYSLTLMLPERRCCSTPGTSTLEGRCADARAFAPSCVGWIHSTPDSPGASRNGNTSSSPSSMPTGARETTLSPSPMPGSGGLTADATQPRGILKHGGAAGTSLSHPNRQIAFASLNTSPSSKQPAAASTNKSTAQRHTRQVEMMLGASAGGALVACCLTPHGARACRVAFIFPDPIARASMDSVVALRAPPPPLYGETEEAAGPDRKVKGGDAPRLSKTSSVETAAAAADASASTSLFPNYSHRPHFLSADAEQYGVEAWRDPMSALQEDPLLSEGTQRGKETLQQQQKESGNGEGQVVQQPVCRWAVLVSIRNRLYVFSTPSPVGDVSDLASLSSGRDREKNGLQNGASPASISPSRLQHALTGHIEDAFVLYQPRITASVTAAAVVRDASAGRRLTGGHLLVQSPHPPLPPSANTTPVASAATYPAAMDAPLRLSNFISIETAAQSGVTQLRYASPPSVVPTTTTTTASVQSSSSPPAAHTAPGKAPPLRTPPLPPSFLGAPPGTDKLGSASLTNAGTSMTRSASTRAALTAPFLLESSARGSVHLVLPPRPSLNSTESATRTSAAETSESADRTLSGSIKAGGGGGRVVAATPPPVFYWQYGDVLVQGLVLCGAGGLEVGEKIRCLLLLQKSSAVGGEGDLAAQQMDAARAAGLEAGLTTLVEEALRDTETLDTDGGMAAAAAETSTTAENLRQKVDYGENSASSSSAGKRGGKIPGSPPAPPLRAPRVLPIGILSVVNLNSCVQSLRALLREAAPDPARQLGHRRSGHRRLHFGRCTVPLTSTMPVDAGAHTSADKAHGWAVTGAAGGHTHLGHAAAAGAEQLERCTMAALRDASLNFPWLNRLPLTDANTVSKRRTGEGETEGGGHHQRKAHHHHSSRRHRHSADRGGRDEQGTVHPPLTSTEKEGDHGKLDSKVRADTSMGDVSETTAALVVPVPLISAALARGDIDAPLLNRLRVVLAAYQARSPLLLNTPAVAVLRAAAEANLAYAIAESQKGVASTASPMSSPQMFAPAHSTVAAVRVAAEQGWDKAHQALLAQTAAAAPPGPLGDGMEPTANADADTVPQIALGGRYSARHIFPAQQTRDEAALLSLRPDAEVLVGFAASYSHLVLTTTEGIYLFAHAALLPLAEAALCWRQELVYHAVTTTNSTVQGTATKPGALYGVVADQSAPDMFYLASSSRLVRLQTTSLCAAAAAGRRQLVVQLLAKAASTAPPTEGGKTFESGNTTAMRTVSPHTVKSTTVEVVVPSTLRYEVRVSAHLPELKGGQEGGTWEEQSEDGSDRSGSSNAASHTRRGGRHAGDTRRWQHADPNEEGEGDDVDMETRSHGSRGDVDAVSWPSASSRGSGAGSRPRRHFTAAALNGSTAASEAGSAQMESAAIFAGLSTAPDSGIQRAVMASLVGQPAAHRGRTDLPDSLAGTSVAATGTGRQGTSHVHSAGPVHHGAAQHFLRHANRTAMAPSVQGPGSVSASGSAADLAASPSMGSPDMLPDSHLLRPALSSPEFGIGNRTNARSGVGAYNGNAMSPISPDLGPRSHTFLGSSGSLVTMTGTGQELHRQPSTHVTAVAYHPAPLPSERVFEPLTQYASPTQTRVGTLISPREREEESEHGRHAQAHHHHHPHQMVSQPLSIQSSSSHRDGGQDGHASVTASPRHLGASRAITHGAVAAGGIGAASNTEDHALIAFLCENPLLHYLLQRRLPQDLSQVAMVTALPTLNDNVQLWVGETRALNIPGFGALPGSVGLTPLPTLSQSLPQSSSISAALTNNAVTSLLLQRPCGVDYYAADHLYEMAIAVCVGHLSGRNRAKKRFDKSAAPQGLSCEDQVLLHRVRHAYGHHLLSQMRYLEAAVQFGKAPGGPTPLSTTLVELVRVFRAAHQLEPLALLLRLRLAALEDSAQGLGGHSLTVSVLATWLVSVWMELCSLARAQGQQLTSADVLDAETDNTVTGRRGPRSSRAAFEGGGGGECADHTNDLHCTRAAWIRRRYHLDYPVSLLEDTMLRYGRFVDNTVLANTVTHLAAAQEAVLVSELQGSPEHTVRNLVLRRHQNFAGLLRLQALLNDPTSQSAQTRLLLHTLIAPERLTTPKTKMVDEPGGTAATIPNTIGASDLRAHGTMQLQTVFTDRSRPGGEASAAAAASDTLLRGTTPIHPDKLAALCISVGPLLLSCYPCRFVQDGLLALLHERVDVPLPPQRLLPALMHYCVSQNESVVEASGDPFVVLRALALARAQQQQQQDTSHTGKKRHCDRSSLKGRSTERGKGTRQLAASGKLSTTEMQEQLYPLSAPGTIVESRQADDARTEDSLPSRTTADSQSPPHTQSITSSTSAVGSPDPNAEAVNGSGSTPLSVLSTTTASESVSARLEKREAAAARQQLQLVPPAWTSGSASGSVDEDVLLSDRPPGSGTSPPPPATAMQTIDSDAGTAEPRAPLQRQPQRVRPCLSSGSAVTPQDSDVDSAVVAALQSPLERVLRPGADEWRGGKEDEGSSNAEATWTSSRSLSHISSASSQGHRVRERDTTAAPAPADKAVEAVENAGLSLGDAYGDHLVLAASPLLATKTAGSSASSSSSNSSSTRHSSSVDGQLDNNSSSGESSGDGTETVEEDDDHHDAEDGDDEDAEERRRVRVRRQQQRRAAAAIELRHALAPTLPAALLDAALKPNLTGPATATAAAHLNESELQRASQHAAMLYLAEVVTRQVPQLPRIRRSDVAVFVGYVGILARDGMEEALQAMVEEAALQYIRARETASRNADSFSSSATDTDTEAEAEVPPASAHVSYVLMHLFRLCAAYQRWSGCVWVYYGLGYHREAIELALARVHGEEGVRLAVRLLGLLEDGDERRSHLVAATPPPPGPSVSANTTSSAAPRKKAPCIVSPTIIAEDADGERVQFAPEQNETRTSRRALWMLVAQHLIRGGGMTRHGAQTALQLSLGGLGGGGRGSSSGSGSTSRFNVTDVLPELPDSLFMTEIKAQLLAAVRALSQEMSALRSNTAAMARDVHVLHDELHVMALQPLQMQSEERCVLCGQPALARPFTIYPRCRHLIHSSCYQQARQGLIERRGALHAEQQVQQRVRAAKGRELVEEVRSPLMSDGGGSSRRGSATGSLSTFSHVPWRGGRTGVQEEGAEDKLKMGGRGAAPVDAMECLLCSRSYLRAMLDAPLSDPCIGDGGRQLVQQAMLR